MRISLFLLACVAAMSVACHTARPIIDPGPKQSVGGSIAGLVSAADPAVAVPGRTITAIEVSTGTRYDTTTAANGGYTLQVPEGTYRLEIELRTGETLTKRPNQTQVNNGDLDPGRDFIITVRTQR